MSEKLNVLVVDDDRRMVKTICDILRVKGHSAEPAFSGEEAIEKVKAAAPDCVLMDFKMEGIDGIETLKRLKGVAPSLPVVMMSAYATGEQSAEAKLYGAVTILPKPIDIQEILSFLSHIRDEVHLEITPEGKRVADVQHRTGEKDRGTDEATV